MPRVFKRGARVHHPRIAAEADVVEEEPIVDHSRRRSPRALPVRSSATASFELGGDARIAREVIERAGRNDGQRLAGASHTGSDG